MKNALLLTGRPGVGKTTVVERVADRLEDVRIAGFLTREIRDPGGRRVGFRAEPFGGAPLTMAHVEIEGPPRVSKYGVDVSAIDRVSESALARREEVDVYLIDEIGKMECFSDRFVRAVRELLEGEEPLVATVGLRGGGLIREAKERAGTELWEVTRENRDEIPGRAVGWLRERLAKAG